MRKIDTSVGPVEVPALTRKEIREGKTVGLRYFGIPEIGERFEDLRDYCIGVVFGVEALDDLTNADQNLIFAAIIAETWGDPGEEKNLPTSGPGARTHDA